MERRVPPRRSRTLSVAKSGKRRLDRFDRDLLAFVLSWAPYGGLPENECFVEFGMSSDRVRERCVEVVCTARAAEFGESECALLLRGSRLLLGPVQRDRRSATPVARPKVNRFARRAVSTRNRRGAVAGRTPTASPTVTLPPFSTQQ
jgi:hypothetical protein